MSVQLNNHIHLSEKKVAKSSRTDIVSLLGAPVFAGSVLDKS